MAERIVFSATGAAEPGDVYVANADGSDERRLTDVNRDSARRAGACLARASGAVGGGRPARRGLVLWPGAGTRSPPLMLEIHGGPHALYGNAFFHEFQLLAARGYHVLYTNPRGSRATASVHRPRSQAPGAS